MLIFGAIEQIDVRPGDLGRLRQAVYTTHTIVDVVHVSTIPRLQQGQEQQRQKTRRHQHARALWAWTHQPVDGVVNLRNERQHATPTSRADSDDEGFSDES